MNERCPHGEPIDNQNDWLGWSFCEECPDCIAQPASPEPQPGDSNA
jgi:hypothetical protein